MSGVDIKQRFTEAIRQRGVDDKYIDQNEEREILQIALQLGMTRDAAHADLARVCGESGYVLETDVVRAIRGQLVGTLDRREFDRLVSTARDAVQGRQTDQQIRQLVVTAIEDSPTARVKTGWFTNWFKAVKRELGMR